MAEWDTQFTGRCKYLIEAEMYNLVSCVHTYAVLRIRALVQQYVAICSKTESGTTEVVQTSWTLV